MTEVPRIHVWAPANTSVDLTELARTGPPKPEGSYPVRVDFDEALELADAITRCHVAAFPPGIG